MSSTSNMVHSHFPVHFRVQVLGHAYVISNAEGGATDLSVLQACA